MPECRRSPSRTFLLSKPESSPAVTLILLRQAHLVKYSSDYLTSDRDGRIVEFVAIAVRHFVDEGLGHSSYLVDLGDGTGLVVDPPRIPDPHRRAARDIGVDIRWTADTHSHADFISGSPQLAAAGATFLAPRDAGLESEHQPIAAGDTVELAGRVSLRAIATPGHTPDHLAYLLHDGDEPLALFSGGSLMVGTVGRTDLLGPDHAEPLARELFRSLRDEILTLPDDLPVYPTHGAGSFCSAPGASARTTTIGAERTANPYLGIDDEDSFATTLLEGFGSFPPYFQRLPEINRRGPALYDRLPDLPRLSIDAFDDIVDRGARIVDARPISAFGRGHVPGSLSNALRPVFGTWLGWLVDPDTPVVFILDDDSDRRELVRQCLDVGHDNIVGELAGGISAWEAAGLPLDHTPVLDPDGAPADTLTETAVIDVRQAVEFAAGHVPGARSVELGSVAQASLRSRFWSCVATASAR